MKRISSGLVAFSLLALAGHARADIRTTGSFTAVDLQGLMEVDVEVGKSLTVDLQGPADLVKLVTTTVKNGTLEINTPDEFSKKLKGRGDIDLKVVVRMPALSKVTISGTGEIDVEGITGRRLDASILGTGELELEGKIELLKLTVQGTGQVKAKELIAAAVELSVSGTAQATVHASKSIEANVQGTAVVNVLGKPRAVKKNVAGTAVIDVK